MKQRATQGRASSGRLSDRRCLAIPSVQPASSKWVAPAPARQPGDNGRKGEHGTLTLPGRRAGAESPPLLLPVDSVIRRAKAEEQMAGPRHNPVDAAAPKVSLLDRLFRRRPVAPEPRGPEGVGRRQLMG